jgi:hypothetical protein
MDAVARTVEGGMMDWFSFTFGLAVGMAIMGLIVAYIISR